jgi:putative solute:sodium symporter small subunit
MLLMLVGFVVTFGVSFFARELSFSVFGWPFSFWIASQGALVVYLVLVSVYARVMHRLDVRHGVAEDD